MKSGLWLIIGMMMIALNAWAADPSPLNGAERLPSPERFAQAGAIKMKVLKNNVNLRAKPIPAAEVVGQVAANDILISKSMDSEWVEIAAPTNVDLWVLGDYVKDGVIQCRQKVNIRSGPGINFAIVGQLASGDKVTPRGITTEWAKIAPPETCSLWVSRSLVEVVVDKPAKAEPVGVEPAKVEPARVEPVKAEPVPAAPVKKSEEKAAPKPPAPKPVERVAVPVLLRANETGSVTGKTDSAGEAKEQPAIPGGAPPDLELIPSLGQGQWKQYDGTLRPRGVFCRTPSRYRLVTYDKDGSGATVCYVKGNNDQLSTLINRPMIISGREYWVQKQTYPVLIPERIVLK